MRTAPGPIWSIRRHTVGNTFFASLVVAALTGCATPTPTRTPTPDATAQPNALTSTPPLRLHFETVRSILHDSKGNYWFGSWNEGVGRYDGTGLTYFTTKDGLSHNQIRSIYEHKNGLVWFEGAVGMTSFDGEKLVAAGQLDYSRKNKWSLGEGDLWVKDGAEMGATEQEGAPGAYRYDGATFSYHTYPLPITPGLMTGNAAYATTGFARGKSGRVWFATYNAVFGYDGSAFTVFDDARLQRNESTGRMHCRCVFEDSRGNVWIGNNGIGVWLFDGTNVTDFTQKHGLGKAGAHAGRTTRLPGDFVGAGPSLHRVFAIGEDRDGNIWFGTIASGAWRYDGKTVRHFGAADGLTSEDIVCIYTDRRGDLWLAGSGVFRWNGTALDAMF